MAKKILTLAVLEAALVELLVKAKDSTVEKELKAFQADFKALCDQPVQIDQMQIKELTAANELLTADLGKAKAGIEQSKAIIGELKDRLKVSESKGAIASGKNIVEIDGVKHVIHHGAAPYSVKELLENPEECKRILSIEGQKAISKFKS
jgi:hypothetical protein